MQKMLIFDQDGTVIDSFPAFYRALEDTCLNHSKKIADPETIRQKIGTHHGRDILGEIFDRDLDERVGEYRMLLQNYDHLRTLYPKVKSTLNELNQHYLLAMISAKSKYKVIHHCQYHKIDNFFVDIEGTAITGKSPMINQLMEKYNIVPQNCVMIGDSLTDMQAGKDSDVHTILCNYGYGEKNDILYSLADEHIDAFSEIHLSLQTIFQL